MPNVLPRSRFASVAPTAPLSSTAQSPTDGSPPNPVAGPKDAQSGFLSKLFSSSSYSFDAKSSAELYDAAAAVTSATLSISPLFTSQATLPWSTLRLALDAFRVSVRRAEDYYGSQGAVGVLSAANYAQLLVGLGEVASRGRVRSLSDWAATDVPANREDVERLHAFAPIAHAAYQASAVDVSRACAAEGVDATVIHADPVGTADRAAFFILHRSVTPATRTSGSAAASVSAMQGSADEIVVTFRGTQSMGDLVTDLVSWPAPFLDSYAHEGMSRTAALLQPAVVSALAHHLPALMGFRRRDGAWERPSPSHPGQVQRFASSLELLADPSVALPRVVFTGHSLGAGVAMCMALAMRHHRLPAASTFADGDAQGADAAAEEQRLATLTETFAARLQPECVLFAAPACLSPRLSQRANDFTINAVCADDMVPRLSEFSMAHMLLQLHNIGKSRGASAPATAPAEGSSGADTAVGTPEASGQKGGWRLGTKMEAELKQLIGLYQKHVSERPSQPKQPRSKAPKKKKGASAADDDPAEASAGSAVATTEGGLIPVGATSKGKGNRTAKRIGELVGSVPTAVTGFVGSVPSAVTGLVGSVPSAVTGLVGSVPTAVSGLVGSVPTAVSSALKSEAVTSALKKPSEWASKLPASLRFKGRKPGAAETTMADANAEPLGLVAADAAAAGAIYTPLSRSSDAFSPEQAAIAPEEQTPSEAALRGLAARAQKAIEQYAAVIRANAAASATDELSDACMSSAPSAGDGTATASMAADPAAAKLSEGPVQLLSSAITRLVEASTLNPATRATTSSESGTALPQLAPPAHDDALVTTDSSAPPPPYRAPAPRSLTFNGAPLPVSASIPFRSAAGGTAVGADFLRAAAAEAAAARDAGMPLGSEEVTAMLDHPLVVDACGDGEAPRVTLTDADAVDWDAQFLNGKYDPYAAADAASHVERKLEQVADVSVDKIAEAEEAAVRGVGSIVQKTRKAVADTQSATLAGISAAVSSASSRVESTTNDTSDRLRSLAQKASSLAQSSSTMPKPVRDALAQSAAALEGVAAEVVAASSSQKTALEKTAAEAADAVASVVASIDSSLTLSNDFVGQTASRTAEQLTSVVSATSHAAVETTSKARETAWRASVAQKQTAEKVMTNLDKAAHRTFEAQARSLLTALMSRSSSTSKAESIAAVEVTEAEATVETANGFLLVGPVEALSRPTRTPTEERIHALKDLREVDAFGKPLLTAERVSSSGLQILLTPSNVIYLKRMPPNGTPVSMASSTAIAKREKMRETRKNLIKEAIQASANPASITPTQDASEDSSNAAKDPNDVPLVGLDSFKVQWQAVKRSPYAFSEMIVSEAMLTDHLMKRYKTGLGAVLRRT